MLAVSSSNEFAHLGIKTTESSSSASRNTLGQSDFLKLLATQLKNQDPLNPIDNEAFVAQMAQFSSVTGISEMNQKLSAISDKLGPDALTTAASLVGKSALVQANMLRNDGNQPSRLSVEMPAGVTDAYVKITDASGRQIRILPVTRVDDAQGETSWDGKDSNGADVIAKDAYLSASGTSNSQTVKLGTSAWAIIDRATVASGSNPSSVTLRGIGTRALSSIRAIGN